MDDPLVGCRNSKRHKALSSVLLGDYECDKRILNRASAAVVDPVNGGSSIDYSAKFAILLDKLKTPL